MAFTSQLDRLPDELILKILKYAMIRDAPFHLGDCIRTATDVQSSVEWQDKVRDQPPPEIDWCFPIPREKTEKKESKPIDYAKPGSPWRLYDASTGIQKDHLRDWRIAGSVCKRIRRMGKEAFFSSKVIAMDIPLAKRLQGLSLSRMSLEDQRTAAKYINSIVLIEDILTTASPWIPLPRCVAGFPKLTSLDFLFGHRRHFPNDRRPLPAQERVQPPSHFSDILTAIGVPTEKLAIGILIEPYNEWGWSESRLKGEVYPGLRVWAAMKLARGTKMKATDGS